MTRSGTIPLSEIEWVKIYFNTRKLRSTTNNLKRMLVDSGGNFLMNAAIFLRSGKLCCHLKADGAVKCKPNYTAWGISWNAASDFTVEQVPSSKANYMECVHAIIGGKKIDQMHYGADMKYKTHRTAVGTKDGRFAYYVTQNNYSPEQLRDVLYGAGWDNAIMMDGGGSTCFMDSDGNGFTGDGRVIPFFLAVKLKHGDAFEPKGERPMVEINAYSKKNDGEKKLSSNFRVKEFACKDGSDAVLVAPRLVMVLQSIRDHFDAPVSITSGYRTTQYNAKVGGVDQSQHCYGTAADIAVKGVGVDTVAAYARKIMPDWGGVGIYKFQGFVHVDVRETRADWNG